MQPINEMLVSRLSTSYDGDPWHGKSITAVLSISDQPLPIKALELMNHMIAWRAYVADILNGSTYRINLNTPEDWPPVTQSQAEIFNSLEQSQLKLMNAIKGFDPTRWHDQISNAQSTYYIICQGVIDHDIYHSGQLVYLIRGDKN